MNDHDEIELRRYLRAGLPAMDLELRRDLWSDIEGRLEKNDKRVPWFDWFLLGAAAAGLIGLPQIIPVLLYHL
jgi:hypothetical protein